MTAGGGREPRLAATLVVVRPRPEGPRTGGLRPDGAGGAAGRGGPVPYEVCMIRRAPGMRVLPGYMAFPGGVLEEGDFVTADAWLSAAAQDARSAGVQAGLQPDIPSPPLFTAPPAFAAPTAENRAGALERLYAALLCAAVRELQEEVGLSLTSPSADLPEGRPAPVGDTGLRREAGVPGVSGISGLPGGSGGGLLTAVRYIGRRVTPAVLPARYDAHFFVARAAAPDAAFVLAATEVESAFWLSPGAVLADPGFLLAPPTRDVLGMLCAFPDLDNLFAAGFLPEQRYI